ncbi:hypothetical protein FRC01_005449 [Tulasnella sp. 417]|nr:hypothetical protein FRC01_005449 [Tulasnella sp. 417]
MSSAPSSSGPDVVTNARDVRRRVDAILTTTVILAPNNPKTSSTKVSVENAVRYIDKRAIIGNDTKSANFWIFASSLEAAACLLKGANILQQFTKRKVVIGPESKESGEVSRLREFVVKNLLPTVADPQPVAVANSLAKPIAISTSPPNCSTRRIQNDPEAAHSSTQSLSSQLPQRKKDYYNKDQTSHEPNKALETAEAMPRDDASVGWTPPSPTPSSISSQSDVFYSATSSFCDDLVPQLATVPGDMIPANSSEAQTTESEFSPKLLPVEPPRPSQAPGSRSRRLLPPPTASASINSGPPVKRVKLGKSVSGATTPVSLSTSSSLLRPFVDGASSQQIHTSKSFGDLPREAQETILQYTLPKVARAHEVEPGYIPDAIKSYYKEIHSLMDVCKGWKSSIEALSKLWTHITNSMPFDVVDTQLARSKGEGLKIAYLGSVDHSDATDEAHYAFKHFMNKIATHRQRWTSLVIVDFPADKGNSSLQAVFDLPAPSLREVFIGTRNNMPLSIWKPLNFKIGAPNLRVLCVHGATPDLGDYPFSRQLEVLHIVNPAWINTIHLIGVLAINHTIRDLKLVNIKLALGEERLKQDIDVFDLPRLESFTLSTLDTSAEFGQLFTRLYAPNCKEYNISVDLDQLGSSRIESKAASTTIEWNLLGFGLQQFLDILGERIGRNMVYSEGERQWFDWKEAPNTVPVFEWRSGCFADKVATGPSFWIRFRTRNREGVYEWIDQVERYADECRVMRERRNGHGSRGTETGGLLAN